MKNKVNDLSKLLGDFSRILNTKPSEERMYKEVSMMKFKIKPLQGDISTIDFKNKKLIEILWSLGKLDEFFHREYKKLAVNQRLIFFRIFDNFSKKFQEELNQVNLKPEKIIKEPVSLEMEIFKENTLTKKSN